MDWAHLHPGHGTITETDWEDLGHERSLPLAGAGTPDVAEFCIAEFALAAGMNTDAGRRYLGDALETFHRLTRVWDRVQSGTLPAWRARRIAAATRTLPAEGAEFVDRHVAAVAHRVGLTALDKLVDRGPGPVRPRRGRAKPPARPPRPSTSPSTSPTPDADAQVDITAQVDLPDAVDLDTVLDLAPPCSRNRAPPTRSAYAAPKPSACSRAASSPPTASPLPPDRSHRGASC